MAEDTTTPSRRWRVLLVLSLALNLLVAGLVVGAVVSGRVGDGPPRSFDLGTGPLAQALTPQERRQIGVALRRDRTLRNANLREGAVQIIATLQADPFDPGAFAAALADQSTRMTQVQRAAQDAMVDQINAMSPQRRQEFATRLREELIRARPLRQQRSGG